VFPVVTSKVIVQRNGIWPSSFLQSAGYNTAIEYFEECLTKANQSDDAALSVHCMEALEGLGDA